MDRLGRIEYRRLRAPGEDAQILVEPEAALVGQLVGQNRAAGREYAAALGDARTVSSIADAARASCLKLAFDYTRQYRDVGRPDNDAPLLLTGHQPQLFHPGVWFKHFAVDVFARQVGGIACNLIVDTDDATNLSVAVPTGSRERPRIAQLALDAQLPSRPYEERPVANFDCFSTFGSRAVTTLGKLAPNAIVGSWWTTVCARARATRRIGLAISQARHRLEGEWGLTTLELPCHAVCDSWGFRLFLAQLLRDLPRFWEIHNRELTRFRQLHRLRSRSHPVPALQRQENWFESPFWIWTEDAPQRLPLFVLRRSGKIQLRAGSRLLCRLEAGPDPELHGLAEQLAELAKTGIKIRSRALTTTLFARLFLGDLFVHGIGGAKYDQLTDAIIAGFWQVTPPHYVAVTATRMLPVGRHLAMPPEPTHFERQARDLRFHPERFLEPTRIPVSERQQVEQIVARKRRWIGTPQTPHNARERHLAIDQANQALQGWLAPLWTAWQRRRETAAAQRAAASVLRHREYAFCLFDEPSLRELLNQAESICSPAS